MVIGRNMVKLCSYTDHDQTMVIDRHRVKLVIDRVMVAL